MARTMDPQLLGRINTPVAFIIFNRPDTTWKVLQEIARAKPPKLLVIADGPRPDRPGEAEQCAAARAVIERVDWDCEVLTNYSNENMSCPRRIPSGLDWVFEHTEEAIILEDDCMPHPTFFPFCEELLDRYRDDKRIAVISGDNFQFGCKRTKYSYYFSRYPHCWGWATWHRAWKNYDGDIKAWPEIRDEKWLDDFLADKRAVHYWSRIFNDMYEGRRNAWGHKWTFACWIQDALTILPNENLVSNIGFGAEATHTRMITNRAFMKVEPMEFPLLHPPFVIRDSVADISTERICFSKTPYSNTIDKFRHALYVFKELLSKN